MKFLSGILFLISFANYIRGDLLDGLDHSHGDHDDHDIDHDDLADHFEELRSSHEDVLDTEALPDFQRDLFREIEKFLPDREHQILAPSPDSGSINQFEGISLNPEVNLVESNVLPQSQGIPLIPEVTGDRLQAKPETFFDIALEKQAPAEAVVIAPIAIDESFDSIEELLSPLDEDFSVALSPASLSLDSASDDFDDINANVIGGQGRQLNAFEAAELPVAPNSFNLLDGNFPNYDFVPETSFTCSDKEHYGYYADTESGCQAFHICLDSSLVASFLCPNGTLFNQNYFVCDWWFNVDCSLAPESYQLNSLIGVIPESDELEFDDYSEFDDFS